MNRKTRVYFWLALALLISVQACKDKKDDFTFNYQYEYYPIDLHRYIEYDVDSITYLYNGNYNNDTARYQLREEVTDTFYDNAGKLNYELQLFRRADSSEGWAFYKKWFISRDTTRVLKTEDDLKFVKMVFPPVSGQAWNGNMYIPTTPPYDVFRDWEYHYGTVDSAVTVNGLNFSQAVVVNQADDESLIKKIWRKEVYAKNVGMVYQEWEAMEKQNVTKDWNTGPESGFRIRMKIRAHYP